MAPSINFERDEFVESGIFSKESNNGQRAWLWLCWGFGGRVRARVSRACHEHARSGHLLTFTAGPGPGCRFQGSCQGLISGLRKTTRLSCLSETRTRMRGTCVTLHFLIEAWWCSIYEDTVNCKLAERAWAGFWHGLGAKHQYYRRNELRDWSVFFFFAWSICSDPSQTHNGSHSRCMDLIY